MSELQYPFEQIPQPGHTLEVAPGVLWLRMPLPMALDHINLYLLDDGDGWWIIDTGIGGKTTQGHWLRIFEHELGGRPVKAVLATHMHPDHVGQAGWLCERWRVPLYMTFGEYYSARVFSAMTADDIGWTTETYFQQVGMGPEHVDAMRRNWRGFGSVAERLPGAFRRLAEGTTLGIGGHEWRVMVGRGHSPEHACLYSESLGVLLSGDQVIPRISPNVGVMPTEPEADPLALWFDSLRRFRSLPEDTLVLPAHNTPFRGLHPRLNALIAHHEDHLLALEQACAESPRCARDLLPVLFSRELDASQLGMALGECVAHLNHLYLAGRLLREVHDGVHLYRTRDPQRLVGLPTAHQRDDGPVAV